MQPYLCRTGILRDVYERKYMKRISSLPLLLVACSCLAATQQNSSTISVVVRPEVLLTSSPGMVNLKLRLSEGASAQLWTADSCGAPPAIVSTSTVSKSGQIDVSAESVAVPTYTISKSGAYQIQLSSLSGSGKTVCLWSSDGMAAQTKVNGF